MNLSTNLAHTIFRRNILKVMNRRTTTPRPRPTAKAIQIESSCAQPVLSLKISTTSLTKATAKKNATKNATAPFIVLTAPQHTFMIAGKRGKKEKILASTNNNNNNNNNNN